MAIGKGFSLQLKDLKNKHQLPPSGEVTLGIRPSEFIPTPVSEYSNKNTLTLPIKVCEYAGSQSVLISDINKSRVLVEVDSHHAFKVGDNIKFSIKPSDVYLFDRNTELAIY